MVRAQPDRHVSQRLSRHVDRAQSHSRLRRFPLGWRPRAATAPTAFTEDLAVCRRHSQTRGPSRCSSPSPNDLLRGAGDDHAVDDHAARRCRRVQCGRARHHSRHARVKVHVALRAACRCTPAAQASPTAGTPTPPVCECCETPREIHHKPVPCTRSSVSLRYNNASATTGPEALARACRGGARRAEHEAGRSAARWRWR